MTRRISLLVAVTTLAAIAIAAAAIAASGGNATLTANTGSKFVINKYAQDQSRWTPGTVTVGPHGTLTVKSKPGPPHTFSIVKTSDLPKTPRQIEQCKVCERLGKAHGAPEGHSDAPPKHPVLDVGGAGIDQVGDSVVLRPGKATTLKISAKKGTTLHFMCVIHPWMQGTLQVR